MLLHSTGRFLFARPREPGVELTAAIAAFVGVPRHIASFHSPAFGCGGNFVYRGVGIRDTLAVVERQPIADQQLVLFLDFRQIGAPLQFALLSQERLLYEELYSLLPRQPPPGWRLVLQEGRQHSDYIRVHHCETLTLGFVHVRCPAPAPAFSLSSSDDDEGEEEEPSEDHTARKPVPDLAAGMVLGEAFAPHLPRTTRTKATSSKQR